MSVLFTSERPGTVFTSDPKETRFTSDPKETFFTSEQMQTDFTSEDIDDMSRNLADEFFTDWVMTNDTDDLELDTLDDFRPLVRSFFWDWEGRTLRAIEQLIRNELAGLVIEEENNA